MVARSTSESTANKYEETAIDINSVKDEKDCSFPNLLFMKRVHFIRIIISWPFGFSERSFRIRTVRPDLYATRLYGQIPMQNW